jgi:uncharacterized membrane protein
MKTSILKAFTYRVFGTLVTAGIALLVTHRWQFVGLIGGADFAVKVAAYFLHEEFWRRKGAKSASVLAPSCCTGAANSSPGGMQHDSGTSTSNPRTFTC